MEEPLEEFWLFASVSRTDTTLTKKIKYKEDISGRTTLKIPFVIFSCNAFDGLPKEDNIGFKNKESSVGEPLVEFWLFPSVNGTDTTSTKEIKYKKELSGGTPCKITVVIFS